MRSRYLRGWRHSTALLLFITSFSHSQLGFSYADFSGQVVGVLDGDTIEVLPSGGLHNKTKRVRLHGIDCPETRQAFGTRAKQATSALVFAQYVTLDIHGRDKYKRILADVLLADGRKVNHELVKDGWCWWYRKYAPRDTVLEVLEQEARESKKGLWVDPDPIPPWEWRNVKQRGLLPSA